MLSFKMLAKKVGEETYTPDGGCPPGSCPAVLERSDGKLVVVGKLMSAAEQSDLASAKMVSVYGDEQAVIVDKEMLNTVFQALSRKI